jgi:hypothetical protein
MRFKFKLAEKRFTVYCKPAESIVAGGVRAKLVRQVPPRRAGLKDPKGAVEYATVIYTGNAARLVRQHWFDSGPFKIVEFVARDSRAPV